MVFKHFLFTGSLALFAGLLFTGCGSNPKDPTISEATAGHEEMVRYLADLSVQMAADNPFLGTRKLDQMRAMPLEGNSAQRCQQLFGLGLQELFMGNEAEAIARLEEAWEVGRPVKDQANIVNQTLYYLGVANLRLAETQNCCEQHTAESCILPLQEGGLHTREAGSLAAIKYLEKYLARVPAQFVNHHSAKWLLNLAYMTLGRYPAEVPEAWRIDPDVLFGSNTFPRFQNIAGELGLDRFNLSGGIIVDDFNNDQQLDVLTSTWDTAGELNLHLNNGDGTFTRQDNGVSGLAGLFGGLNMMQADFNNDGWVDVLILRGAWLSELGNHPNSLLRNNGVNKEGQLSFTDVTVETGLAATNYPTQCAGWADYDNDGDLDLYIGNEAGPNAQVPSQLFRNNGVDENGGVTFTDVAASAGVLNGGFSKGVTWGDYDADGRMDLYVSNLGGPNRLYRNLGDQAFTDVAPALGVNAPISSFPAWFWDFNNDGVLDLFVSNYPRSTGEVAAHYSGMLTKDEQLCGFYQGLATGGFRNVARTVEMTMPTMPMGSNFGDLNNDGYLDFYLGTGNPDYASVMPNRMFLNHGGARFEDVTIPGGFGHLQKGHGIAFADFDGDGDQDVFEQMGGAFPGDKYYDAVFENPGFDNNWISIHLVGTRSNRSAIGARVKVVVAAERSIYRHVTSGGSFGAQPLRQLVGLGKAEGIDHLEIRWPAGQIETFEAIEPNQAVQIVEGEQRIRKL